MTGEREQIIVACDDRIGAGCDGEREYIIVVQIAARWGGERWRIDDFRDYPQIAEHLIEIDSGLSDDLREFGALENVCQLG